MIRILELEQSETEIALCVFLKAEIPKSGCVYPATVSLSGAVSVIMPDGSRFGIIPGEFEYVTASLS
jgi:hypothetical protein